MFKILIKILIVYKQIQIGSHAFTFDHVFGSTGHPSSRIFDDCVAPIVDALFHGYNGTVLAYGQVWHPHILWCLLVHCPVMFMKVVKREISNPQIWAHKLCLYLFLISFVSWNLLDKVWAYQVLCGFLKCKTGSGKTYTMGTNYNGEEHNGGIIPKVVETIFSRVQATRDSTEFLIRISFIEVSIQTNFGAFLYSIMFIPLDRSLTCFQWTCGIVDI